MKNNEWDATRKYLAVTLGAALCLWGNLAIREFRDQVNIPNYEEIISSQIQVYDGRAVELNMSPVYLEGNGKFGPIGKGNPLEIFLNGGGQLRAKPHNISHSFWTARKGHPLNPVTIENAWHEMQDRMTERNYQNVTVKGILNGDTLDMHELNVNGKHYNFLDGD